MNSSDSDAADREIVMMRILDAPRELVWKVWTETDHLSQWWGPQGFTTTTQKRDCRTGGVWRFVMHGPDGRDYENNITYLEVVAPERLSYKHGGDQDREPVNFQVTVRFTPEGIGGEKTRLDMRMIFPSKAARDFVIREYNAVEGGKQTMGRLAEYLQRLVATANDSDPDRPFVITRVLRAPLDQVWKAWTDVDGMRQWFCPPGAKISGATLGFREGGQFHYEITSADGQTSWRRWGFEKIVPAQRIEIVASFSDAQGGVTRSPTNEHWPLEIRLVATFAEHAGVGRGTVVTLECSVQNGTATERRVFAAADDAMIQEWTELFDRLAECLATS